MNTVCVLTGDLIDSQRYQTEQYIEALRRILNDLEKMGKIVRYEIYRGDEFQITAVPEWGIRCALYLRAALKAQHSEWDAKISVAFGSETEQDGSYGTAYLNSGEKLDNLSANKRMQFAVEEQEFAVLADTMDFIINGWSQTTARAVMTRLVTRTGKEAAERLGVSPANVSRALKRGGYEVLLGLAGFIYEVGGLDDHPAS